MKPDLHFNRKKQADAEQGSVALFAAMLMSREADIREDILFRQGRGQFHVSSSGHEALAGIAGLMHENDYLYCHYRDRALLLARGMPLHSMALGYFAKAGSSSGGRQMVNHFSDASLNVVSAATPTGLQCLPAAGTAWGLKKNSGDSLVFCSIGDAGTRQGEFFEALAFSIQEKLPIVFLVEDNGYGISTPTEKLTPLGLDFLNPGFLKVIDARNPFRLSRDLAPLVTAARAGEGPTVAWLKLDRLASHTASDDHARYRAAAELNSMGERDPLLLARQELVERGNLSNKTAAGMQERIKSEVRRVYAEAEQAPDPGAHQAGTHVFSESGFASAKVAALKLEPAPAEGGWTMASAFNQALRSILGGNGRALVFGEDVEDPKGGVFGLTKGLSTCYPGRVINSPLAEATIAGLASGLPVTGYLPIFELQFIDFVGPAFNQIVNQVATLRWRSLGSFTCPLVLYAPCGSFIGNGGPWHSQTNESWFAHAPGLKVYMPSNANDAAHMLCGAAQGDDPVLMLLPKNQLQKKTPPENELTLYPERAKIRRPGDHVSLVAWGNCVDLALEAAEMLQREDVSAEVIDLRSIVPCDWQTLHASVRKTGRLVVVQEDNRTCSFGQAIISELCSQQATWDRLYAPPQLVCRGDVHIGFSRVLEKAVLPDALKVADRARLTLGRTHE